MFLFSSSLFLFRVRDHLAVLDRRPPLLLVSGPISEVAWGLDVGVFRVALCFGPGRTLVRYLRRDHLRLLPGLYV